MIESVGTVWIGLHGDNSTKAIYHSIDNSFVFVELIWRKIESRSGPGQRR